MGNGGLRMSVARVAVLSDEGTEYLDDRGVVSLGVDGDALKGVDAAQAHVEFIGGAELLDGLGVAVGELALLGEPVSTVGKNKPARAARPASPATRAVRKLLAACRRASGLALVTSPYSNGGSLQTAQMSPASTARLAKMLTSSQSQRTDRCLNSTPCLLLLEL